MAIPSSDGSYVTVEYGDCLWNIARDYLGSGLKYTQLADWNNIPSPYYIYVNQKVKIKAPSSSNSSAAASNTVTITAFGVQSMSNNTLFATWTWAKENDHTQHYEVEWYYTTGDKAGDNVIWFVGTKTTTEDLMHTWNIPDNALKVRLRVKPIAESRKTGNSETPYWTAEWSKYADATHDVRDNPPKKPPTPTVELDELDKCKINISLDNLDVNATHIEFEVVKNDKTVLTPKPRVAITTNHAAYSRKVDAGGEYKVRCRSYKDGDYSEWSDYSSSVSSTPAAPTNLKDPKSTSESSVYLEWDAVKTATSYDIEYTTERDNFDMSDDTTTKTGIKFTRWEITDLEPGKEYYFRVRAVNSAGASSWSDIKSVAIGKAPSAPTTWSSTTTAIVGEPLYLYWNHNSEDGSSQTVAELELYIDDFKESHTILNSTDEDEKDKTSVYLVDTSTYLEGTKIQWRVKTAGVTNQFGEWSTPRVIDVYAQPTLDLSLLDIEDNRVETLTSFPLCITAVAGPIRQIPTSYQLVVTANEAYETVDNIGQIRAVNKGEAVYSQYFDISESLRVTLSAGDLDLANNIRYTVTCTVAMNSGLTTESYAEFVVGWAEKTYAPNAIINVDLETLVAHICPYCDEYAHTYYRVDKVDDEYIPTNEVVNVSWGHPLSTLPPVWDQNGDEPVAYQDAPVKTTTGERVYSGVLADGTEVYYYKTQAGTRVDGVTLSVYRRESNGTFVEIARNIDNSGHTFVTDPHPALDYARYRIVATETATGAVSYYDIPGHPIGIKSAVFQWDETYSSFDTTNEDAIESQVWSGSMIRLPYNLDVKESHSPDVELIEYVGREQPVSYYGTQRGYTAAWSAEIDKHDTETLYALRRLARWMGDVYVREPSGTGYWANVTVSFSQRHCELTIPVEFDIKRVEGGI